MLTAFCSRFHTDLAKVNLFLFRVNPMSLRPLYKSAAFDNCHQHKTKFSTAFAEGQTWRMIN